MTVGDGCGLDEKLFLDHTFNCNSCCVNGEELLLFFQLLNIVGTGKCKQHHVVGRRIKLHLP
ncbi:hypothetical protein FT639_28045 [Bacillus mycoides]|nr:hypothetical protein [Bacillus mycoides]